MGEGGGFKQCTFFVSQIWRPKTKIKVCAGLVPSQHSEDLLQASLLGLLMAGFSWCLHMAFSPMRTQVIMISS